MLSASQTHPNQIAMLVPSPFGLTCDQEIQDLIANDYLGDLREYVVLGGTDQFLDYSQPLHWRQDEAISGQNVLALGILHETWLRWFPQPSRLLAQTQLFEPVRPNPDGPGNLPVTVPDSLQVLTQQSAGARGIYHFSGVQRFGSGFQMHLYGSSATVKITL